MIVGFTDCDRRENVSGERLTELMELQKIVIVIVMMGWGS